MFGLIEAEQRKAMIKLGGVAAAAGILSRLKVDTADEVARTSSGATRNWLKRFWTRCCRLNAWRKQTAAAYRRWFARLRLRC